MIKILKYCYNRLENVSGIIMTFVSMYFYINDLRIKAMFSLLIAILCFQQQMINDLKKDLLEARESSLGHHEAALNLIDDIIERLKRK